MKKILLLVLVCTLGFAYNSKASSIYTVDDAAIETTLNLATAVTLNLSSEMPSILNPMSTLASKSDKNFVTALVLGIFLGGLAIHRIYLGSKPVMIFYYIITGCGIFGVVPLIDWINIIISKNDLGKFDNNKYFMWSGK
jgi:TM2 domain-containing membrane protein YozV